MREPNAPVTPICDSCWMVADQDFITLLDLFTVKLANGDRTIKEAKNTAEAAKMVRLLVGEG